MSLTDILQTVNNLLKNITNKMCLSKVLGHLVIDSDVFGTSDINIVFLKDISLVGVLIIVVNMANTLRRKLS